MDTKNSAAAKAIVTDPAFRDLPQSVCDDILHAAELRSFDDGQRICGRGDTSEAAYIIVSGGISLSSTTEDGRQHTFNIWPAGTWIGESSVLDDGPRFCDFHAHGPTTLLMLPSREVERLMQAHYVFARAMLRLEAVRLRLLIEAMQLHFVKPVENRLAHRLLGLVFTSNRVREVGGNLEVDLTQEELAQLIGSTRQRVNQLLRHWQDKGVVELAKNGTVSILDRAQLVELSKF